MKSLMTLVLLFSSIAYGQTNMGFHIVKCSDNHSSKSVEIRIKGKSKLEYEKAGAQLFITKKKSEWKEVLVESFENLQVGNMELSLDDSNNSYLTALTLGLGRSGYFQFEGNSHKEFSTIRSTLMNFNIASEKLKCEYYFSSPRPISGGNH